MPKRIDFPLEMHGYFYESTQECCVWQGPALVKVFGRRVLDMQQELPDGDQISVKISLFLGHWSEQLSDEPLVFHKLFPFEISVTKRLMFGHVVGHF